MKPPVPDEQPLGEKPTSMSKLPLTTHVEIEQKLHAWIHNKSFTQKGLTIIQLSDYLGTNRTYTYDFIRVKYGMSFCEWITQLRIEYAKKLMRESPEMPISKVAEMCGYNSTPHFNSVFKGDENLTPSKWKREKMRV